MGASVPSHAFVDTNVLLTATSPGRLGHEAALEVLGGWPRQRVPLFCSGQILREYLVVATRPADANGLGLATHDALTNIRSLRRRLHLLDEDRAVADRLAALVEKFDVRGKQVHDANVTATMLEHGLVTLVTANARHFARFAGLLDVRDLLQLP